MPSSLSPSMVRTVAFTPLPVAATVRQQRLRCAGSSTMSYLVAVPSSVLLATRYSATAAAACTPALSTAVLAFALPELIQRNSVHLPALQYPDCRSPRAAAIRSVHAGRSVRRSLRQLEALQREVRAR